MQTEGDLFGNIQTGSFSKDFNFIEVRFLLFRLSGVIGFQEVAMYYIEVALFCPRCCYITIIKNNSKRLVFLLSQYDKLVSHKKTVYA